ncbi:MAG TPA: metal ABC transporter permease [Beijerinckiaceae bacterium]|jgi:manganese/zinc/iron transport system permease protein
MITFLQIDFAALLAATLAALSCALVGNFLVLTRRAMVSDALSHVMLPGVLVAFLITGSTAVLPMLAGGVAVGLLAVALVSFLIRTAKVEASAALGVVFTSFFAGGVLLMEQSGVARTAFDVHHVITGNLEALVWPTAKGLVSLVTPSDLAEMPRAIGRLAVILVLVAAIVLSFAKELAAIAFDPDFARASGLPVGALDLVLLVATALATVAAFESVGIVLAVAMIVCPAATARMLTDRLAPQVMLSVVVALAVVWGGYALAVLGPPALGFEIALNAAGTIGALSGLLFVAAVLYRRWSRSVPRQDAAEGLSRGSPVRSR